VRVVPVCRRGRCCFFLDAILPAIANRMQNKLIF